jgi:hypothetical protein
VWEGCVGVFGAWVGEVYEGVVGDEVMWGWEPALSGSFSISRHS